MSDITSSVPTPLAIPAGPGFGLPESIVGAFNAAKRAVTGAVSVATEPLTRFGTGRAAAITTLALVDVADALMFKGASDFPAWDYRRLPLQLLYGVTAVGLTVVATSLFARDYHFFKHLPLALVSKRNLHLRTAVEQALRTPKEDRMLPPGELAAKRKAKSIAQEAIAAARLEARRQNPHLAEKRAAKGEEIQNAVARLKADSAMVPA